MTGAGCSCGRAADLEGEAAAPHPRVIVMASDFRGRTHGESYEGVGRLLAYIEIVDA
jgi:hypothetical protein